MLGQRRFSGLTRIELLVVAAVIVGAVMLILPMFRREGKQAYRMTCGANLSLIGKTMLIYGAANDGEFPQAGVGPTAWAARTPDWRATDVASAFGANPYQYAGATISASLYLLVKYAELPPRAFVCTHDKGAIAFKPSDYGARGELDSFWDFGPNPPRHVSYSYHMPYSQYALTPSRPAGMAVAADRNPWMDSPFAQARDFTKFKPDAGPYNGTIEEVHAGNSPSHEGDGQNVVFLDCHVEFAKTPNGGIDGDNIYTSWDGSDQARGLPPVLGSVPADPNDSLLVNDPAVPVP